MVLNVAIAERCCENRIGCKLTANLNFKSVEMYRACDSDTMTACVKAAEKFQEGKMYYSFVNETMHL